MVRDDKGSLLLKRFAREEIAALETVICAVGRLAEQSEVPASLFVCELNSIAP